jgi:hypothetical protein
MSGRYFTRLRSRTPLQKTVAALLILVDTVGMVAVSSGHSGVGGAVIGFNVIANFPFLVWMARTAVEPQDVVDDLWTRLLGFSRAQASAAYSLPLHGSAASSFSGSPS